MAVTDLTDSMPWWLRGPQSGSAGGYGGTPPSGWGGQGPGASGGPAATPQGAGANGMGWLNYLQQMFGASPAQADTLTTNQQLNQLLQNQQGGAVQPNSNNAINPAASLPPGPALGELRQAGAAQGPPGYLNSTGATGGVPVASMGLAGGPQPGISAPAMVPGAGGAAPTTPGAGPLASPAAAAAPRPAPTGTGGAGGQLSTSNPRFIALDYRPNASPQNSMRAGPQATALNLAGLFGGGQGAAAPAPQGSPSSTPRPPGPLAQGGSMSRAPSSMGPNLPGGPNMTSAQLANAVSQPNWWQNLGGAAGRQMSPTQLASAIHRPNWYRNLG